MGSGTVEPPPPNLTLLPWIGPFILESMHYANIVGGIGCLGDGKMTSTTTCKESKHKMHMCALKTAGFDKNNSARFKELTANPKYKCGDCGATAAKSENLCKPVKL